MNPSQLEEQIRSGVEQGKSELTIQLLRWVEAHQVPPRRVDVALNPEGTATGHVWLVTDDTGENDASYRVVYDEAEASFGLECTLKSGVSWYMGPYGSFANAVESM